MTQYEISFGEGIETFSKTSQSQYTVPNEINTNKHTYLTEMQKLEKNMAN